MKQIKQFREWSLRAAFVGLTLLAVTQLPAQNLTGLGSAELDNYIAQQMWQMRTPGLAVLVVDQDGVVWSKGYGYADVEQQIAVTPDTVFLLASVSKTVVATAVMQLWEQGQLELDDDVNDYLPFSVRSPYFPDVPITFRMLLRHDSGLTQAAGLVSLDLIEFGADSPIALGDFLSEFFVPGGAYYSPAFTFNSSQPGTTYEYTNLGYSLLGYLVERISGKPFPQYCHDNIFQPLGMNHTAWRLADLFAANIKPAIPYIYSHTTQSYFAFGHFALPDYPPSGLRSSANDLARFLLAHMNGGTFGGVTILQPATVAMMHTAYHTGETRQPLDGSLSYETFGYGFGFELKVREPQQQDYSVGHGGLHFGVATEMHFRPDQGVGVIVLANAAGGIQTVAGVQEIIGRELCTYSAVPERLLDEAAAAQ